jgi:hypothetical protein
MTKKIKQLLSIGLIFCALLSAQAQGGFKLPKKLDKHKMKFELVNNLVVIPVRVNGAKLSFILDTGVSSTILFAFKEVDSVEIKNVKPVKLRGLGAGDPIDALKSVGNRLEIGDAIDTESTLYVIFDEDLNFSPRMGTSINGIIGYDFFKNFVVKTNYISQKLTFYKPETYVPKTCNKCDTFDLSFNNNKPYINIQNTPGTADEELTLLVDSGSSDALWLFDEKNKIDTIQKNYFDDFLGLGLSGNIYGKRSKLAEISIGKFKLSKVKVAFPAPEFLENIRLFKERDGSIGGDLLKRFTVWMNYSENKMTLQKNSNFRAPFYYNMSGLIVEHDGMVLVNEFEKIRNTSMNTIEADNHNGMVTIRMSALMNQLLAPRFVVAEVRKNSPADYAGVIIGDEILTVNGKPSHKYKLHELVAMFTSEEGKIINLQIERNGDKSYKKFRLKKVI